MHDVYTLGAPLLVILVGLIYNGQQVRDLRLEMRGMRDELRGEMVGMRDELRGEMHGMRDELRGDIQRLTTRMDVRLDGLHHDLTEFSREQGKHDARLDALEKQGL